ncbi:alpha-E domain-containing protein [Halomonas dongshanensis]|uniref:Alpha-E domain-containing protein n=1 Tax=Halomonas dongshanensis TaxID=2890835 RepID=A0ABT2EAW5_9GAMM|nr:alpha-E domain-containing protein [Halomonas dongshanensis]MCS2608710.1 alpha-E domain-containing protein [Halomonas dongshanensis]
MLSRVAENLYWMARYVERAEDTARLVSVNSHLMLDLPRHLPLGWAPLIDMSGSLESFRERHANAGEYSFDENSVVHFLCADPQNGVSILSSLANARENLRTTRDVVPREVWEEVNQLYLYVADHGEAGVSQRRRDHFLKSVIRGCQAVSGLIGGTLSFGAASTFIDLGRQLERADMTSRILDVRSASLLPQNPDELLPFENLQWMSVLKSLTAYQMYRQQIRLRVRGPDVLRFLLQDAHLPRSIACCLATVGSCLQRLPRHDRAAAMASLVRADAVEADIQALANSPSKLHAFIDELQIGFGLLHETISSTYFATAEGAAPTPHSTYASQYTSAYHSQYQGQYQGRRGDNDND